MASFPGRDRRVDLRLDHVGRADLERALSHTLDRVNAIARAAQERAETGSSTADKRISVALFVNRRQEP
jgi:hypothetical protein